MKRRAIMAIVLGLVALALPAAADAAQPRASLDLTFGVRGVLVGPGFGEQRIAQDRSGQLLAAAGMPGAFRVARYLRSGTPDMSFGRDGIAVVPLLGARGATVTAIRVQPDGKVLIAGRYIANLGEGYDRTTAVLARLNLDGSLDTDFGGFGGFWESPGLIVTSRIDAILLQRGKIVVAGEAGRGYVGRFNLDGSHDRSFSGDGWARVPPMKPGYIYPINGFTGVSGLVPGRGGSLYATGWAKGKLMVARLRADGRLARRFGTRGIVRTWVRGYAPCHCLRATGVARDRRGRLLVVGTINADAGWSTKVAPRKVVLARYWPNGKLDRSFGGGGVVYAAAASSTHGNGVVVQRDGRILVAGSAAKGRVGTADGPARLVVFRFLSDGRPDRSFFGDGTFAARFGAFSSIATQALIQPSGRLVVAGLAIFEAPYADLRGLTVRFRMGH